MPDAILSKLASFTKVETIDDLREAVSSWGYANKYGDEVFSLLRDADCEHQTESQAQRMKTRQLNKKRKIGDLERDEQQNLGRSGWPGLSPTPVTLVHTRMIEPVVVKNVAHFTRQPSRPRPRPVLISHPYTRTDIFDCLMGN